MANDSFETRQWVPYPVELVFAFFANPHNLLHISPPALHARLESVQIVPPPPRPLAQDPARRFQSLAAGVGSELAISFRPLSWLPVRMHWTARIVEFAWNSHFVDEQVRGPFAYFRHRHGIEAQSSAGGEGTLITDQVEFALRGSVLNMVAKTAVRRQLEAQFAERQRRLEDVLARAARQASRQP